MALFALQAIGSIEIVPSSGLAKLAGTTPNVSDSARLLKTKVDQIFLGMNIG
jgi:hypothetical protein